MTAAGPEWRGSPDADTRCPARSGASGYIRPVSPLSHAPTRRAAAVVGISALVLVLFDAPVGAQDVIEGETTIVNLRETDGRLGPLVMTLVAMGAGTLFATMLFWWMTRPKRRHPERNTNG